MIQILYELIVTYIDMCKDQMTIPNQIVEDATILSGIVEINRSVKIHLNNERWCMVNEMLI
jgi:hypothetical protein